MHGSLHSLVHDSHIKNLNRNGQNTADKQAMSEGLKLGDQMVSGSIPTEGPRFNFKKYSICGKTRGGSAM